MDQNKFRRTVVVCLLLGLGTIALYAPTLTFSFVNFDDQLYVTQNPHVKQGLSAGGLGWAFQAGYAANWHPVTWLSHMLDVQLFGLRAGGHHASNVLLHALNSVLLLLALARMTGAFWRSAAVAALFAWHPLHVESVAWIAERKDVLSTFFWMLSLCAWVRYVEKRTTRSAKCGVFYGLSLLFFALGLMSKPMVVTLPCVLLLLDWWPLGRLKLEPASAGADNPPPVARQISLLVAEKIPFFVLSIVSAIISVIAMHREGSSLVTAQLPFQYRLVSASYACFRYLAKTFWPSDLGAVYPAVRNLPKAQVALVAMVLAGIFIGALRAWKTRPYWLFGWLWFLGTLFPTLNLTAAGGQWMADRYMYIPSVGLFVLICWEASDWAAASRHGRTMLSCLCGVALAGCCVATSFQLQHWRNEESVLSHIAMTESNYVGHANYAAFLMHHNQLAAAESECRKALGITPGYALVDGLLGYILLLEGKYDEAIDTLRMALILNPSLVDARLPLGRAMLAKQMPGEAATQFQTVLQAAPRNFEADTWLARAWMAQGRTAEGITEFRRSLRLQPNQPEALNDLAWLLATSPDATVRDGAEAVKLAARACELTHNERPLLVGTLAAACAEAARWDEAVAAAQKAHDLAVADGLKALAEKDLKLQELYRSHHAFRDKQ